MVFLYATGAVAQTWKRGLLTLGLVVCVHTVQCCLVLVLLFDCLKTVALVLAL